MCVCYFHILHTHKWHKLLINQVISAMRMSRRKRRGGGTVSNSQTTKITATVGSGSALTAGGPTNDVQRSGSTPPTGGSLLPTTGSDSTQSPTGGSLIPTTVCESCLLWYHFKCSGVTKQPKAKTWFCRKCHADAKQ